jgi:hypothetical protein
VIVIWQLKNNECVDRSGSQTSWLQSETGYSFAGQCHHLYVFWSWTTGKNSTFVSCHTPPDLSVKIQLYVSRIKFINSIVRQNVAVSLWHGIVAGVDKHKLLAELHFGLRVDKMDETKWIHYSQEMSNQGINTRFLEKDAREFQMCRFGN